MGKKTAKDSESDVKAAGDRPDEYGDVLAGLTKLIAAARQRTASSVNRELLLLYWQIGTVIVHQQNRSGWGESVIKQLADDLRTSFPDLKGLSSANVFRMRQFGVSCAEIDGWLQDVGRSQPSSAKEVAPEDTKVVTVSRLLSGGENSATQDNSIARRWTSRSNCRTKNQRSASCFANRRTASRCVSL